MDFGTVLIIVSLVAAGIAVFAFLGAGKAYDGIGKGGLGLDGHEQDLGRPQPIETATGRAEQEAEVRQMLEAKSARREARGEAPLDVNAELAELLKPASPGAGDPALREEVRQLVAARNARRTRRGEEPLDVEAEVDRQLRELG